MLTVTQSESSLISRNMVGSSRATIASLAGENSESLSLSIHANSLATSLERLNQIGSPVSLSFSRHVRTKRVDRTCDLQVSLLCLRALA